MYTGGEIRSTACILEEKLELLDVYLVTNLNQMPKYKQLNILIYGFLDNDFYALNKDIAKHVQTYILQKKFI